MLKKTYTHPCFRLVPKDKCRLSAGEEKNRLTVLGLPFYCRLGDVRSEQHAVCACRCGTVGVFNLLRVASGACQSCGCRRSDAMSEAIATHGQSHTRLYRIWKALKERCHNQNAEHYADYGARGVTVCEEWRGSFTAFQEWALANGYREDLTIDRREVNGHYEPGNCRWATIPQQSSNRRRRRTSSTAFKGVTRYKGTRFIARCRSKHLGIFDTQEDAAKAYDEAALKEYGEFANLNFPSPVLQKAG